MGKSLGSLLLIGAAYGIIEEGLMVASFQNPFWVDLGVLDSFGRWIGVNWDWAVELTIYHAIVSITIPVLLVELIYPMYKTNPWLFGSWRRILPSLFASNVVVGFYLFTQFTGFIPPIPQYVFFILLCVLFLYWAYKLPSDWVRRGNKAIRKPRFYFLVAFLGSIASGFVFGVLLEKLSFTGAPVLVTIFGTVTILGSLHILTSYDWKMSSPLHYHMLIFGSLLIFILFSFFHEMDASRLDDTTGMSVVGTIFLIAFLLLGQKINEKMRASA